MYRVYSERNGNIGFVRNKYEMIDYFVSEGFDVKKKDDYDFSFDLFEDGLYCDEIQLSEIEVSIDYF